MCSPDISLKIYVDVIFKGGDGGGWDVILVILFKFVAAKQKCCLKYRSYN